VPFALFVLFEAALAPAALVLGWALGQPPLAGFAWDPLAALEGAAAALPMLLLLAASVRWPVGPLARIKEFFDREVAPALRGCGWTDLALVSVAAGVGEEMLFRGVIQGAIARALGPAAGVVLTAALFGLLHPVSPAYVAIAAALGAYLGAAWLITGNLLTVMVAHALYDFVALVVLLRESRADAEPDGG
jgi:membrane protease YdiL (CAAX protease family)